ncbi:cytochrome P450 2J4-like isoform X2 [Amphibalanus amphitrite]|nr:cytochrome P450 2J4-like isoform X2 [Amphibalanus amphitrite]
MNQNHPEKAFVEWQRQYGPLYSVKMGSDLMVVISDPALLREAFNKPASTGRMAGPVLEMLGVQRGLIFSVGEDWHVRRRFTLFHLRNFGMGKARLEDVIREQVDAFLEHVVAPSEGQPLTIDHSLDLAVVNIIWGIVAGETMSMKDTRVLDILEKNKSVADKAKRLNIAVMVPWLLKVLPRSLFRLDEVIELFNYPKTHLIAPVLEAHRRDFDPTSEPRDYIECFLLEQRSDPQRFTDEVLARSIGDMFSAGSDTTSTTLRWAFCLLCARPEAQRRIQAEIDQVVGASRPPSAADRQQMPFTEAFLMETQRFGDIVPMGVLHSAEQEFELGGYTIPRGTILVSLLRAIHRNPAHFPEPEQFKPERFLDREGRVRPSKALMPFSVGKRSCLGEAMARSELFLFLTCALQRYSFAFPAGFQHDLSSADRLGVTTPKPFEVVPTRRR